MSNTININNEEVSLDTLSDEVKRLISIHGKWSEELQSTRLEMAKTEAALRDLSAEIIATIQKDQNAKKSLEDDGFVAE